jgi:hypothetical protein
VRPSPDINLLNAIIFQTSPQGGRPATELQVKYHVSLPTLAKSVNALNMSPETSSLREFLGLHRVPWLMCLTEKTEGMLQHVPWDPWSSTGGRRAAQRITSASSWYCFLQTYKVPKEILRGCQTWLSRKRWTGGSFRIFL